ncbi:MAG: VanZ family protein [Gammaproteobacteria bacterium]|nr:VanZ family protein [Gammaproteobacteria bacterium]MDH5303939.1 VanZ family protein [Gammaproteobacteria bacterium]MDH5321096.1 VanZ family protein [Gammaproteobacteria bacterium]
MLPLRYALHWRAAGIFLLLAVLAGALMPAVWFWEDRAGFLNWFVNVDKWLHGVTFVVLAVWFGGQYRSDFYWRIGVGLLLFGVLIEVCQRMVTYRSAEWFDLVADAAGIALGLIIGRAWLGGWSLRVEAWLGGRNSGDAVD